MVAAIHSLVSCRSLVRILETNIRRGALLLGQLSQTVFPFHFAMLNLSHLYLLFILASGFHGEALPYSILLHSLCLPLQAIFGYVG